MHYLLETARALWPSVRESAILCQGTKPSNPVLAELNAACKKAFAEQEIRRMQDKEAVRAGCFSARVQKSAKSPPAGNGQPEWWATTGEVRCIEILADVLAAHAARIPDALREAGSSFYPSFLSYLLQTSIESAQPKYRPRSASGWLWWNLWTWVAASEYVALLRDRHQKVASVLARTDSWRTVASSDSRETEPRVEDAPRSPGTGQPGATVSILGTGEIVPSSQRVAAGIRAVVSNLMARGAGKEASEGGCQALIDVLTNGGPTKERFLTLLATELLTDVMLVRRLAEVSGAAVPFGSAFDLELAEIMGSRTQRRDPSDVHARQNVIDTRTRYAPRAAAEVKLFGLAFSGGGIRSATFNLGVLQGLAQAGLLRRVDYLSTVSGGGYIGAWLATWIKRSRQDQAERGVRDVEKQLRIEPLPSPDEERVRPVRFLREYSNYLTPQKGFLTADTWTMVAIWLRNTMLNQCVLVLTLASILTVPWMIWTWTALLLIAARSDGKAPELFVSSPFLMSAASLLLLFASRVAGKELSRYHSKPKDRQKDKASMLGQAGVFLWIVLPAIVGAWLLSVTLYGARERFAEATFRQYALIELLILFLAGSVLVARRGQYWRCFAADRISSRFTRESVSGRTSRVWALFIIALGSALPAIAGAWAIVAVTWSFANARDLKGYPALSIQWTALGVPIVVSIFALMVVLKLGIYGRNLLDAHREWWSRLGAWLFIVTLTWLGLFFFGVYASHLLKFAVARLETSVVASGGVVWVVWTAAGVLLGKSEKPSNLTAAFRNTRIRGWIVTTAPYAFIAGLLVLVATGACWFVTGMAPADVNDAATAAAHWTNWGHLRPWLLFGPILFLTSAFLMSGRVDVNEFSMHHFYKNRLVRCYLGASRDRRTDIAHRCPDPFTGFDAADDVELVDLRLAPCGLDKDYHDAKAQQNEESLESYIGPLPIINTALNLVHGDDLAWQERKAQSFSFTPFCSGYQLGESAHSPDDRFAPYGFRPTLLYGYPPFGINLGTAVGISGAAVSPNMGYHTSPAAAFLMTMFNARLGWWMGNPRDKYNWLRSGPRRGLLYLVNELFGLTNDRTHFVNLSDGGHFENLGVYELVRRRCRYIVACDAEQDDALTFNGLGNAIRKCRTDLGTEISVRATRIQPPNGTGHSALHCVVGDILYPDGEPGTLLYLKASVTGDEPADVLEYKARQHAFPHHSTMSDQFFDESQFESYRKLGFHVVQTAFSVPGSAELSLEDRFNELRDYWYPASSAIEQHFSGHAMQYEALLERLRQTPGLDFLDGAFFEPAGTNRGERQELFVGASMLDLMQRVFIDLNLERDGQHPHNAGWMAIFRNWMRHEAVLSAWKASRESYGRRFRRFVDSLQNGDATATAVTSEPNIEQSSSSIRKATRAKEVSTVRSALSRRTCRERTPATPR
jgi:Patatin-like phospholipase